MNNEQKQCPNCGKAITQKEGEKPSELRERKFCNLSCATTYNNRHYPKRRKPTVYKPRVVTCEECGCDVELKKKGYRRRYCDNCLPRIKANKTSERFPNARVRRSEIGGLTKEKLLKLAGNPYRFKLYVTAHAKRTYTEAYPDESTCLLCGFEHMQICHLKDVAEFSGDTSVEEINSPKNLVGLCPNHHWLLDNAKLSKDDLAEIEEAHHCK